ncbi:uncharacterized protein LY79DRAFT_556099 [Colletotrichum navitas]|uniref:Uncharacterized protein n=1 Tax=Colletotrichum navitas TaxID=681940 RepID=A0AAD8PYE5_9PEZI|nr:uncharacterized protein LY79DRAFT_556099 [Colletotrichum navitas]KAK1589927.1 hypothetical protein LY79DRAFT_556099 [Colletotrichum navitas]
MTVQKPRGIICLYDPNHECLTQCHLTPRFFREKKSYSLCLNCWYRSKYRYCEK